MELSSHGRADANAATANLSAASAPAVGAGDASAGGELLALSVADIPSTGIVGGEGHHGDGDWREGTLTLGPD